MSKNLNIDWITRRNAEALASGSGVFMRVDGRYPGVSHTEVRAALHARTASSVHIPAGIKTGSVVGIIAGVGLMAAAAGYLWNRSPERKSWVDRVEQEQQQPLYR